jgi:hypothetical protein
VLDLAANASDDDVRRGYADVMRDAGLGQVAE